MGTKRERSREKKIHMGFISGIYRTRGTQLASNYRINETGGYELLPFAHFRFRFRFKSPGHNFERNLVRYMTAIAKVKPLTITRTRTNTIPYDTKANAAG